MSLKNKQNNNGKKMLLLISVVLVVGIILFIFVLQQSKENSNTDSDITNIEKDSIVANEKDICIPLGNDVNIIGVKPYSGSFVEDGSDEYVENTMMLIIENRGSNNIQLANVIINDSYVFEFTTLLSGETILVLEKNRAKYDADLNITSTEISNVALFEEAPSMYAELLEITGEDNVITIKNISNETFNGGKVFYKNVLNDKLLGGITYSGTIPELKSGESVKLSSNHFIKDSSRLIFVTYAE